MCMASAEGPQQAQHNTDAQTQLTVLSESQQAQQGTDRLAQQPGPGLNLDAQQAQQGLPAGGLLIKPKPVGIGHMCRAISTLTGGIDIFIYLQQLTVVFVPVMCIVFL